MAGGGKLEYQKRGRRNRSVNDGDVYIYKTKAVRPRMLHTKRHGPMAPERIKLLAQKLLAKRAKESLEPKGE